jgi:hypothetical protein
MLLEGNAAGGWPFIGSPAQFGGTADDIRIASVVIAPAAMICASALGRRNGDVSMGAEGTGPSPPPVFHR